MQLTTLTEYFFLYPFFLEFSLCRQTCASYFITWENWSHLSWTYCNLTPTSKIICMSKSIKYTDSDGSNEFSLLFDKSRTKRSRHQWNNVSYCRFCLFFSYIEENLLIFQKQADFVGIIHNNFQSIIFKLTLLVKQNGKTDYKYFQKCQRI